MKLINKNINVITMKYPSSWHKALWREGLVSGNGKIGANVYGGTKRESMLINHKYAYKSQCFMDGYGM